MIDLFIKNKLREEEEEKEEEAEEESNKLEKEYDIVYSIIIFSIKLVFIISIGCKPGSLSSLLFLFLIIIIFPSR